MMRIWGALTFAGVLFGSLAWGQEPDCASCHSSLEQLLQSAPDAGKDLSRFVIDRALLGHSVHATQSCDDCHLDYGSYPHSADRTTAGCSDCHSEAAEVHAASVHGKTGADGKGLVSCSACHGVHDVLKPADRGSKLHPLNVHKTCTSCHFDPAAPPGHPDVWREFAGDVHGRGLIVAGLTVSATCVSCHGKHDIRRADDPASPVSPGNVAATCGNCHVIPHEQYRESIHAIHSGNAKERGATCTDCHPAHGITESDAAFRGTSVDSCSECHSERGTSFRLSYHGKVINLGFDMPVATCDSCHGNHTILPSSDPRSPTHPDHLVATCAKCHESATVSFTQFQVHANPRDAGRYPTLNAVWVAMLVLIGSVMAFGGFHVLAWLGRSVSAREWRLKHQMHEGPHFVRRMRPLHVGINSVATGSILLLAGTGLPLFFSQEPWARELMRVLGGTAAAAFVHRVAAVILMGTFVFFLGHIAWRLFVKKERGMLSGPWTMVPRRKDFQDLLGNIKWFFGRGQKPTFGRWTYWEKFDFWAVFWGMGIMGLTGLMLWFPEAFSLVVPGWLINIAALIHGLEALLAVAFHFAVQAFQTNLRPDKFPLDLGLYTGVIPEAELRHERGEEYEILVREGKLDQVRTPPPSPAARLAARIFGTTTLILGLLLLVMTVFALLSDPGPTFQTR